jgi:hypothetical protein
MHHALLKFNLPLDVEQVLGVKLLHAADLYSYFLSSQPVHCLLDLSEATRADCLLFVKKELLS